MWHPQLIRILLHLLDKYYQENSYYSTKLYLFQSFLEYLKVIHPVDCKAMIHCVCLVQNDNKWQLHLVKDAETSQGIKHKIRPL